MYYISPFGWHCVDAIRMINEIIPAVQSDMEYAELLPNEFDSIWPLHNLLVEHFWQSPMFIGFKECSQDEFHQMNQQRKYRYFVAKFEGKIIAFMRISSQAETFFSSRTYITWEKPESTDEDILRFGEAIIDIIADVRKYKSENNLSIRAEMDTLEIKYGSEFMEWIKKTEMDIKFCANVKEIIYLK